MTLRIDRSEKNGTQLNGIFVQMDNANGMSVAATADHGRFLSTDDPNTILFRLEDGRLVQDSPKFATPRTLAFDSYDLPVNLPAIDKFRGRGGTVSDELYLHELWRVGYGGHDPNLHQKREARAAFNFRLVEVLMRRAICFTLSTMSVTSSRTPTRLENS